MKETIPLGQRSHKKSSKYSLLKEWSKNTCDAHQAGSTTTKINTINHWLKNLGYRT